MSRRWLLAALLLLGAPAAAHAQIFLAARPHPEFTVGPLFVRANVTPSLDPIIVDVLWSVVLPPQRRADDVAQDLYLLWPGQLVGQPNAKPDPTLARYVEARGFTVIDEGRLPLFAQLVEKMGNDGAPQPVAAGAPFVVFVREQGPLGLSEPATYVRIPWVPQLTDPRWLMDLRLNARRLVRPKKASWVEEVFWGPRHLITLGFNDVREPSVFPMYFEHRDRLVRLADDPSQLLINFAASDHLKIDSVAPATASRKFHETLDNTEVVSVFIDRSEGLTPQVVTVQFGYFSGIQAWTPILIPMIFFVLGNAAGPLVTMLVRRLAGKLASRFALGRPRKGEHGRQSGVVLSPETLARIAPGETTYEEVIRLFGRDMEEHEQLPAPGRRRLVYRGRRIVPERRRIFGWLATVSRWDVENHEVTVELDGDRVRDVQARVSRSRLTNPEAADR